ncbi:unnamed protein product [Mesocestoides corti]|uniref:Uncharacterized protein n=1 Tax=Mesocestoides corti TaxID=53468 RepID=A0A158QUF8_MESCO|nr:unnamed protein product [Mesocestoides corti]
MRQLKQASNKASFSSNPAIWQAQGELSKGFSCPAPMGGLGSPAGVRAQVPSSVPPAPPLDPTHLPTSPLLTANLIPPDGHPCIPLQNMRSRRTFAAFVRTQPRCLRSMAIVFHLPPRNYQFLALQTIVYWAIVAGHTASGYSLLIGIPLLPLLVVQIILLMHMWTSLVTKNRFGPVEAPSGPLASRNTSEQALAP